MTWHKSISQKHLAFVPLLLQWLPFMLPLFTARPLRQDHPSPQLSGALGAAVWMAMEKQVVTMPDFDEMVDLLALTRSSDRPTLLASKIATLPLRDALTLVVEDWADDKFRQLSAVITRPSGPAIRSFDDIRALYQQIKAASASGKDRD
jgi:hypothetical protein